MTIYIHHRRWFLCSNKPGPLRRLEYDCLEECFGKCMQSLSLENLVWRRGLRGTGDRLSRVVERDIHTEISPMIGVWHILGGRLLGAMAGFLPIVDMSQCIRIPELTIVCWALQRALRLDRQSMNRPLQPRWLRQEPAKGFASQQSASVSALAIIMRGSRPVCNLATCFDVIRYSTICDPTDNGRQSVFWFRGLPPPWCCEVIGRRR